MEFGMKTSVLLLLLFAFSANAHKCDFPAIFNFGDSNSDTGGANVINKDMTWPNGMTVGKFFKRYSDGRLIIDFIAESLGLPYLNASLDTNGTSFKYGANFAVAGQRANSDPNPSSPVWNYPLSEQVSRFLAFKSRAIECKEPESTNIYPNPSVFSKALYTIDIGQNDVGSLFILKNVTDTLNDYTNSVKRLLNDGAEYLWIHNTCPWGCLPLGITMPCQKPYVKECTIDEYGCRAEYNSLAQAFNAELKKRVDQLRIEYPKAAITLVDMYSAKHTLITKNNEFDDALKYKFCCGSTLVSCGKDSTVCDDPSIYYNWDGVHYTEAGNRYIADLILDGSYSEPCVPLSKACRKA